MTDQLLGVPLEGFAEYSRKEAAEGAVLVKNDHQVLPIREGETVSVFGRIQVNYYRSGHGVWRQCQCSLYDQPVRRLAE